MNKKNLLCLLFLSISMCAWAAGVNNIPTTASNPFDMTKGELHGSRASFGSDNHIDWMNNGDYAVYELNNTIDAKYYDISFGVGTTQPSVSITFALKDVSGKEVWKGTSEIANNNNWGEYLPYSLRTGEMPKGNYTLTITFNSVGGNGTTGNLNHIAFTAKEKFVPVTLDKQPATATFAFGRGEEGQVAALGEAAQYFKATFVEAGDNLKWAGQKSAGGVSQTGFQPTVNNEGSANEDNRIDFMINPLNGLSFTPTKVSFQTTRHGTDGGKVDVSWVNATGSVITLQQGISPARNNASPAVTDVVCEVPNAEASFGPCGLRLNLYGLGNTKIVSFANIVIEGVLNGTSEDVPQYKLVINVDAAAAEYKVSPATDEYSEGDEISISLKENFGYHFKEWQDASGKTVSTENPYTFIIKADTELNAVFDKNEVYALNLKMIDDLENVYGNANMVSIMPEGNVIDGVHYFEDGTDVKLLANNNMILSFTGWEDASTDAERIVHMDGEKNITANFAVADYIVAWDFYKDQPGQNRAADYYSNPENRGMLSLRDAQGNSSGWLTRGVGNGAENGRWGARIWKLRSQGLYFEASFSTKGFSNIVVYNALGVNYNTYAKFRAEYSVDGENFSALGTVDMPSNGWVDCEWSLPAEANEKDRVYIRWVPASEELVGNATDYDGLAISGIYVLAESAQASDDKAPVLISSNPAAGAEGASANGSVVLTFDERIKAGSGCATLNGEELQAQINGKTAVFPYAALDYGKEYIFEMPAGVICDRSGNAFPAFTLKFTTMQRSQPQARLFDVVVAADGSGDFTSVQAAVDAAPAGRATPWLIFIKNGEYKGHVDIPKNKPYLHFIGQERDKVIITDDRLCGGDNAVHVSVGATVVVNANDCYFDNLTLENSWGHDKQAGPQALALNTSGDRTIFKNVAMLSYQDTWITPSTSNYRVYAKDCFIEGAVDFIYNSGNIYIDNTTLYINRKSGGYIVAPSHGSDVKWGYVFMNCRITAPGVPSETDVWLGRPWHNSPKTVFINTIAEVTIPAKGWYPTMGGLPVLWADYNTMDANGNPVDLSQREDTYYYTKDDGTRVYGKAKNYLTAEEAAQYTVKNVLSGSDNWQPALMTESCANPEVRINAGALEWNAVPYAICYVVSKNGEVLGFTKDCTYPYEEGNQYKVQAVNEYGSLSGAGNNAQPDALQQPQRTEDAQVMAIYTLGGVEVKELQEGVNIVKMMDADKRVFYQKVIK